MCSIKYFPVRGGAKIGFDSPIEWIWRHLHLSQNFRLHTGQHGNPYVVIKFEKAQQNALRLVGAICQGVLAEGGGYRPRPRFIAEVYDPYDASILSLYVRRPRRQEKSREKLFREVRTRIKRAMVDPVFAERLRSTKKFLLDNLWVAPTTGPVPAPLKAGDLLLSKSHPGISS